MVPAAGVEPATFRSGGERSNPLSYAGNAVCRKDNTLSADSQIDGFNQRKIEQQSLIAYARQVSNLPNNAQVHLGL